MCSRFPSASFSPYLLSLVLCYFSMIFFWDYGYLSYLLSLSVSIDAEAGVCSPGTLGLPSSQKGSLICVFSLIIILSLIPVMSYM